MCKVSPISCQEYPIPYLPQRLHSWVYLPAMLGSGDGARSTLNSMSKPGTQNKTTQKPGVRTAHERSKKPNTTKRKIGPESAPATSARRTRQARPGGTGRKPDTSFPVYNFWEGPVLGSAPFFVARFWAPFASCVLKRQRSISSFPLQTPTRRFVSRAVKADTTLGYGVGALWGESQA